MLSKIITNAGLIHVRLRMSPPFMQVVEKSAGGVFIATLIARCPTGMSLFR
jgi:hypothetical protein